MDNSNLLESDFRLRIVKMEVGKANGRLMVTTFLVIFYVQVKVFMKA